MGKGRQSILVIYGSVKIPRQFCERCQCLTLVVRGMFQCCDNPATKSPEKWKRESEALGQRKRPSKAEQDARLLVQENRCREQHHLSPTSRATRH